MTANRIIFGDSIFKIINRIDKSIHSDIMMISK